jgi:bifunctional UDP-N-acetylglucosamine pyrophosphorylase / glucosamine-1-phosphate N-acetyltransferase
MGGLVNLASATILSFQGFLPIFMHLAYDDHGNRSRLSLLAQQGVKVWGPERVYVSEDVRLDRISAGAMLVNATITGAATFIGAGTQIGVSGLARVHDAQIGHSVVLGAGSYENCVLLRGSKARGFAEFRQGTVLEEEAETGHNVGLKNTVLMLGVVAGSSINFCDVLLSGGSSRSDHSEIGSGVVHFNFDPRGDKFGSLMGDATACLLQSRRIFLGGNSGIVAPVHLGFGTVVAAGSTLRHDVSANQLSRGDPAGLNCEYDVERYFDLRRKFCNTAKLVGNLHALGAWYQNIRQACAASDNRLLYAAAVQEFDRHIKRRVHELAKVVGKLDRSLSKPCKREQDRVFEKQHRKLIANREHIDSFLLDGSYADVPAILLSEYTENRRTREHMQSVHDLSEEASGVAARWIQEIASGPYLQMCALFD